MRGILRFIFFICKHKKLLPFLRLLVGVWVCYCLILGFCFLQNCQYAKIVNYYSDILEVSTRSCICCWHSPYRTPTCFCDRQGFMGKMFLTFYFKTCSDAGIICVYGLIFFRLRFNVLFPDNYLFFTEMVIRSIKMRILVVCARIVL